jgi:integrase
VIDSLAQRDFRAARDWHERVLRVKPRPYDLRHSFLTEAYRVSRDIRATQELALHTDVRMTRRYTLGAVDERLQDVAKHLAAHYARTLTEISEPTAPPGESHQ